MDSKSVGTQWYKCDFHLHTDAGKCFNDENYIPEKFVDKLTFPRRMGPANL